MRGWKRDRVSREASLPQQHCADSNQVPSHICRVLGYDFEPALAALMQHYIPRYGRHLDEAVTSTLPALDPLHPQDLQFTDPSFNWYELAMGTAMDPAFASNFDQYGLAS